MICKNKTKLTFAPFRNSHESCRLHLLQRRLYPGREQHVQGVGPRASEQVRVRELHQGDEAGPRDGHLDHGVHGEARHPAELHTLRGCALLPQSQEDQSQK